MKWDGGKQAWKNLGREALRMRGCAEESNLSLLEINAFSKMLWEIRCAICDAQPYPRGRGASLSQECMLLIQAAANMAETERRSSSRFGGAYLPDMQESGDVLTLHGDKL